jgi:hypothetical protein
MRISYVEHGRDSYRCRDGAAGGSAVLDGYGCGAMVAGIGFMLMSQVGAFLSLGWCMPHEKHIAALG